MISESRIVYTYGILGPLFGAIILPFVAAGPIDAPPLPNMLIIVFAYLFGGIPATCSGYAYSYYLHRLRGHPPAIKSPGIANQAVNVLAGGAISGLITGTCVLIFSRFSIHSLSNPINIVGALSGLFCAFMLTDTENVGSSEANNG
jgi:hypothetical protein